MTRPLRFRHSRSLPRTAAGVACVLAALALTCTPAIAGKDAADAPTATREELGDAAPGNAPGQTLYLQRVTIPAGVELPDHYHEGTQVAHIRKGVLTYEIFSGTAEVTRRDGSTESVSGPATIRLRPGDSLVEAQSLAHTGANRTKSPVVIEIAALLQTGAPLATPLGTAASGTPFKVEADLVSQETRLGTAGANGAVTYGWNRLTGTASDPSGPVGVELLGSVAYRNGSGPFSGFVTFTFADGATLATQMVGIATPSADGITTFAADMGVLDGTGRYAGAKGSGTFTGSRNAALGQPVDATFSLMLTK